MFVANAGRSGVRRSSADDVVRKAITVDVAILHQEPHLRPGCLYIAAGGMGEDAECWAFEVDTGHGALDIGGRRGLNRSGVFDFEYLFHLPISASERLPTLPFYNSHLYSRKRMGDELGYAIV